MLMHDFLSYYAREEGDQVLAVMGDRTMTYREADEASSQVAHALMASGLEPGDRFAYLSKNSLEYILIFMGASKMGAVPVPLNFRLAAPEWAYIANDAGAKLFIATKGYVNIVNKVRDDFPNVKQFIAIGAEGAEGWDDFDAWTKDQPKTPPDVRVEATAPVYQMYTSGTTGRPKGAVLSQSAINHQMFQLSAATRRDPGDRSLIVAPMYHAAAAITALGTIAVQGTMVIQEDFVPGAVVDALSNEAVAHVMLVPAMIQACLVFVPDVADRSYDDLKSMTYGASPIAEGVLRKAMSIFKCDFYQGYGMTETTACASVLGPKDHERALQGKPELLLSAGRPLVGTEVKIVDENDNTVPNGIVGQICLRGAQNMTGYWNLDEETEIALKDGWMHTGDAGTIDDEGYIYVQDRVKDMIISGGENVYPREVENVLFEHEAVADVAVIGVPSEKWGETIKAIVVLKKDAEATDEELMEFCKDRIAGFKRPTSVDFIPVLPRNASGKVLKKDLRKQYWEGEVRQVS